MSTNTNQTTARVTTFTLLSKEEMVALIKTDVTKWNEYREELKEYRSRLRRAEDVFAPVDLTGVDFTGANLSEANLLRADFTGADLFDADLRGANLEGAIFEGASLHLADFEGANLTGVLLSRTNLWGAKCISEEVLEAYIKALRKSCGHSNH